MIGKIYKTLQRAYPTDNLLEKKYITYWNQNFKRTDIGTRWRECWNINNEITVNENVRLIQYKLMHRIYYTRDKINKFYSMMADSCLVWKLLNNTCLLGCYNVQKLWAELESCLSEVLQCKCTLNPV